MDISELRPTRAAIRTDRSQFAAPGDRSPGQRCAARLQSKLGHDVLRGKHVRATYRRALYARHDGVTLTRSIGGVQREEYDRYAQDDADAEPCADSERDVVVCNDGWPNG